VLGFEEEPDSITFNADENATASGFSYFMDFTSFLF
jgi:hypothetical protein